MTDITVAHPSLNRGGGAERVCLTLIETLINAGYSVNVATLDRINWENLEKRFGKVAKPNSEFYLISNTSSFNPLLQAAAVSLFFPTMLLFLKRREHNLLINTYGDLIEGLADLDYINAIPIKLSYKISSGLSHSIIWRTATCAYDKISSTSLSYRRSLLISNSRFIQSILLKNMNLSSIVIHPPVDVDIFMRKTREKRENLVAIVSRLRPGKRLNIVPKIASLVKEAEFVLLGIADRSSKESMRELTNLIKHLGVGDRVKILLNQQFENYVDVLSSASLYLHTQPSEAFGISVVEAMAAGCVPIVPRSGGPWIDILDCTQGLYGFSYDNERETADLISGLINDKFLRKRVAERARNRALNFKKSIFKEKILNIVNKIFYKRFMPKGSFD